MIIFKHNSALILGFPSNSWAEAHPFPRHIPRLICFKMLGPAYHVETNGNLHSSGLLHFKICKREYSRGFKKQLNYSPSPDNKAPSSCVTSFTNLKNLNSSSPHVLPINANQTGASIACYYIQESQWKAQHSTRCLNAGTNANGSR